jgi:hypothetical protein
MKNILIALTLLSSFSVIADCPHFESQYINCTSSSSQHEIKSIKVRQDAPKYQFTLVGRKEDSKISFIADGIPRDFTLQSGNGSEAHFIQLATCTKDQLILIRTNEDTKTREEIRFIAFQKDIIINELIDHKLVNKTTCSQVSFF